MKKMSGLSIAHLRRRLDLRTPCSVVGNSPAPSIFFFEPEPEPDLTPTFSSLPENWHACLSLSVPVVASARRGAPPQSPSFWCSLKVTADRSIGGT